MKIDIKIYIMTCNNYISCSMKYKEQKGMMQSQVNNSNKGI